ncbi:hypothetical protein PG997_014426 [Apiospora hydei]|uniref:Thioesterase/thiol ester dehydrase-isomerase n=1 Tax=Apiospora hydei TaxID=1337664 RepID=A0ABR1UWW7_9PEZI
MAALRSQARRGFLSLTTSRIRPRSCQAAYTDSKNTTISESSRLQSRRPFSRTAYRSSLQKQQQAPDLPSPPWYADLQARLGKCIIFGCSPAQVHRVAAVLGSLTREWRSLSAGSEGFLQQGGLEGQAVVWGEMDSFQHVNNAAYIRYAEASRVNWIRYFANVNPAHASDWRDLMNPRGVGLIMKSIKADYKFPVVYPDRISVYHKLRSLPSESDTSLILDCMILSHKHRRIAARTEEDVVIYDYREGKKTTMPQFVLQTFRDTWERQEGETRRARLRIQELAREVEALEKETWDREDAVEDLGAAGKAGS